MRLVLASASPRRADLLRAAGYEFEVRPAAVDESVRPGETPEAHVLRLSRSKADLVAGEAARDTIVLGADTVVVADGLLLGKPSDDAEAAAMLRQLAGRAHEVLTGVALRTSSVRLADVARTTVYFAALSEEDLAWYITSGEPRDKAGAYGIQGLASRFVDRIDGSYSNVVGLPVALFTRMLAELRARARR